MGETKDIIYCSNKYKKDIVEMLKGKGYIVTEEQSDLDNLDKIKVENRIIGQQSELEILDKMKVEKENIIKEKEYCEISEILLNKIFKNLGNNSLDDFTYEEDKRIYGFNVGMNDNWEDDGKYQYNEETGKLVEFDENMEVIKEFNYGVYRSVSRTGSYYTDYHHSYSNYELYKIKKYMFLKK